MFVAVYQEFEKYFFVDAFIEIWLEVVLHLSNRDDYIFHPSKNQKKYWVVENIFRKSKVENIQKEER